MDGQVFTVFLAISSILLPSNSFARKKDIDIYSVHVDCQVSSRFARSVITSRVVNRANESREALFEVELPKTAFITNYSMTIDGVVYPGTIKEKKEAQQQYDTAVSRGQSASLVKATGRKMENFEVSVNIAAAGKVVFELVYEELLKRQLGKYELLIKVKPKQLVKHFQIDVHIFEPQGISFVDTSSTFMTNDLFEAITKSVNETKAHVLFKPTIDQQRKSPDGEESLIDGDLTISYDVKRSDMSANDLQIVNGYFVHYFAPPNLPKLPKNVVFVIDRSGSMAGRKIEQTREALIKILADISPEDHFNFIVFNSIIQTWRTSLFPATEENVNGAKDYVQKTRPVGGTNINDALLAAVRMLTKASEDGKLSERSVSMIILLTDGEPTSGVTNLATIQKNIQRAIEGRFTLYCLGFGGDVDYKFLEKLALENGGLARRIYEDSDSALQLQGFYQEVANPTLMKIELQYPENTVSELTKNNFGQFFDGSEIVVAGHIIKDKLNIFTAEIKAQTHASDLVLQVEANVAEKEDTFKHQHYIFGDFIERLWAYLTINQQLEKLVSLEGDEKTSLQNQTLQLSLKYGFVTPLTSMVVTKPDDQEKFLLANKPEEGEKENFPDTILTSQISSAGHIPDDSYSFLRPMKIQTGYGNMFDFVKLLATETVRTTTPPTLPPSLIYGIDYPDFILQLPWQNDSFCIDINIDHQKSLNLVSDPDTGIWVNGKRGSINFASFEIAYKNPEMNLSVTTNRIIIQNQTVSYNLLWKKTDSFSLEGLKISIDKKRRLTITDDDKATIIISNINASKHFLQLFITDGHHFSANVGGLIGQFFLNTHFEPDQYPDPSEDLAMLNVLGQKLMAARGPRKGYNQALIHGAQISCWSVVI
ncbi:inter-alpha-trypsin inhibitor heavy chain H4 isoform X2 [Microcaecilia unicolor]|uniref:Inter-alpha-trypsin inhibitor heavy chain H4-like isoform X2 n=1 Tax=Microcaecilia unicolor TaxID=1415580 RepID=A0A6P7Y9H2_9AMPH|nr:inter-alpha-trypsin inhibitor heavy chain H4-like isoform X2 [Microcaecilia unicolor]